MHYPLSDRASNFVFSRLSFFFFHFYLSLSLSLPTLTPLSYYVYPCLSIHSILSLSLCLPDQSSTIFPCLLLVFPFFSSVFPYPDTLCLSLSILPFSSVPLAVFAWPAEFGDSGVKGGDPFCDPSQGSSSHICISCVLSMKLCVFETPAMRFTISEINDTTLIGLPLG